MQLNANRQAFLDMIATSEGTSNHPLTKNNGYDVIVTGIDASGKSTPEVFTDYTEHPFMHRAPKVINRKGLESTASGRYQILKRFWIIYAAQYHYPSIEPQWQDAYAIQQFRERLALPLIDAGRFDGAVMAISGLWASLPGKAYEDQKQHSMEHLLAVYQQHGGLLTAAPPLFTSTKRS